MKIEDRVKIRDKIAKERKSREYNEEYRKLNIIYYDFRYLQNDRVNEKKIRVEST